MRTARLGSWELDVGSSNARRHFAALLAFVALAIVWTWPLAANLFTHVPGDHAGDNLAFLWNFWWMRAALAEGLDVFRTPYIFAPAGVDLILHTHTAFPAFIGATVLGRLDIAAALNITTILSVALSGFCAYLLASRVTGRFGAAVIAGIIFGGSPFMSARLQGHFNLVAAWVVPLFALAATEALGRTGDGRHTATMPPWRAGAAWAVAAGAIAGLTAYIDYYYVVFEAVLVVCLAVLGGRSWRVRWSGPTPHGRRWAAVVCALVLVDVGLLAAIAMTGGFRFTVAGVRVSAGSGFNLLQILWILLAVWTWLRLRPRLAIDPTGSPASGSPAAQSGNGHQATRRTLLMGIIAGTAILIMLPLASRAARVVASGDYVSQRYLWRSAPKGIDVATLVMPPAFHGIWGAPVRAWQESRGIGTIDGAAALGLVPVVLTCVGLRRWRWDSRVRRWGLIGALFLLWALGPHLMIWGVNTGMILPQAVLRYIPVLENARMPGRAMVMVYMAMAMLCAIAVAEWRTRLPARLGLSIVALAIAAEYLAPPLPLLALDRPPIYDVLRERPEQGAVLELPLGVRDGFGERGALDERVLFYQTIHRRPLVGGFVARLPPSVSRVYDTDLLFRSLLRLSSGLIKDRLPLPDTEVARQSLQRNGVRFLVLDRNIASAQLIEYVEHVLPVEWISEEGGRALYVVR
jgi:hypothetical protein